MSSQKIEHQKVFAPIFTVFVSRSGFLSLIKNIFLRLDYLPMHNPNSERMNIEFLVCYPEGCTKLKLSMLQRTLSATILQNLVQRVNFTLLCIIITLFNVYQTGKAAIGASFSGRKLFCKIFLVMFRRNV